MFSRLTKWDNLLLAYRRASKGKRGKPDVAAFEYRLEDNLWQLIEELKHGTYRPGAYHSFLIHDPKRRLISAAPFRDRVVHHALCNLIEPAFDRSFIEDSYANRLGKGTHAARARCQQFARRFHYALQCDVRQFFPSVDHAILRRQLARKINDARVMWLIDLILNSGKDVLKEEYEMVYFAGDDLLAINRPRPVTEGIPFLGFHIFPNRMRLKRRKGIQYRRRFQWLLEQYTAGEIELDQVTASVKGWVNHARWGNTVGLRKAILSAGKIGPILEIGPI